FGRDVRITIKASDMFASGDADIRQQFVPLLRRIGEELGTVQGQVLIAGHTDNVPIRSLRWPSNQALSQARATNAARTINETLQNDSRIVTRGYADTVPIASNDTPEGKARNRRIVVTLQRPQ